MTTHRNSCINFFEKIFISLKVFKILYCFFVIFKLMFPFFDNFWQKFIAAPVFILSCNFSPI